MRGVCRAPIVLSRVAARLRGRVRPTIGGDRETANFDPCGALAGFGTGPTLLLQPPGVTGEAKIFAAAEGSNSRPAANPVVILGAGLTGLSAAYHLRRGPFMLVEKDAEVGGHARSHREQGYTFDRTGHWLHLRDDRSKALLSDLFPTAPGAEPDWVTVERK